MDFGLTKEQQVLVERAERLVQERIAPRAAQYDLALAEEENAARDRGRARNSTNTSHEHESRFYFAASSSFIACRANEKSRTSSSGRFFSPTRAIIASISGSVIMPSRLSVLSSPS